MSVANEGTEHLLRQLHLGDRQALQTMLSRHLPWLESYVRSRIRTERRRDAETGDYLQEVVIHILTRGPKFIVSCEEHFRSILAKLVRNFLCDRYRKDRAKKRFRGNVRPITSDSILYLDPPVKTSPPPSEIAQQREQIQRLRFCVELLDPADREIIVMHELEDCTYADIGGLLEITPAGARVRFNSAVARLARLVFLLEQRRLAEAIRD